MCVFGNIGAMDFSDILSRIPDRPKWWWGNLPRYDDFGLCSLEFVVADEAALIEVHCEHCGCRFDIAIFWRITEGAEPPASLRDWIELDGYLWCAQNRPIAPWCSCVGSFALQKRVLQFWVKDSYYWRRMPELEIELADSLQT